MASTARHSLLSITRRGVNCIKFSTSSIQHTRSILSKYSARGSMTLKNVAASNSINKAGQWNSHIRLSSSVDQEMSSVLEKEIKAESQQAKAVKNISRWTTDTDGSNVTLSKMHGSEKISVTFSVNNSMFTLDGDLQEEGGDQDMPSQVSSPPFDVDIEKKSGKKLRLVCEFNQEPAFYERQEEEPEDDLFGIVEVQFIEGEEKEKDFFLTGESMDAEMYQVFMDMLDERGIGDSFIQDLTDFCTAYEQLQYIEFLKKLQAFMKE